jgi:hypothetical protein
MTRKMLSLVLILSILFPTTAIAAETSGMLPPDQQPGYQDFSGLYGDRFETTWTTKFKKTGKCKNAQLQFTSKGFFGPPEERAAPTNFYIYSADFKTILETEGMYSKKLENKFDRFTFDYTRPGGKPGENFWSNTRTRCLTLGKEFKSPLQIYYYNLTGEAPYKGQLVASIPFKEKK